MTRVVGTEALAAFRLQWGGAAVLRLLRQRGGRLRIDWPVGVGKSTNIDDVTEAAIRTGQYDLVVVLLPTRLVVNERRWVKSPPSDVSVVTLRPRPAAQCGDAADKRWLELEAMDLGAFGRAEICHGCSSRRRCHWPKQYGRALRGIQVIYGTQAHLQRSPGFIGQLTMWSGASRPLVILDEANFIAKSFHRTITRQELEMFLDALHHLNPSRWGRRTKRWIYLTELLLKATSGDLRCPQWLMPTFWFDWALAVQTVGQQRHGSSFRFLPFELGLFGRSALESREKHTNGDVTFATNPDLDCDFIVYSGTTRSEFTRYRLGRALESPFQHHVFEHPGTRWYNIASRLGTRGHFPKNAPQILDFFAGLVSQRLRDGQRPMLVAKKCFVAFCAREMQARLRALGHRRVRVLTHGFTVRLLADPDVIPLINYGVIGTNKFEHFDAAYCLTGYYVNERVVDSVLQDVLASDIRVPIKINTEGRPCRRLAGALHPGDQVYDVHPLAQCALDSQEIDPVVQAVGRVRPFTRAREIITFQCGAHPSVVYTAEFTSVGEARRWFGIDSRREAKTKATTGRVIELRKQGLTQAEAATQLRVGLRTVKRHWNSDRGATRPNKYVCKGIVAPDTEGTR